MLTLRDYQLDLLNKTRAALSRGAKRLLLVAPTGSGKTVVMAAMARGAAERGRRVQVWEHRRELIEQTTCTFIEAADIHTGIVAAGFPSSPLAPVQVCSVQTLAKRHTQISAPDIIIIDEAHHQASATYTKLAAAYPDAVKIGVTATAARLDGRGLGAHFDELILGPSTADLIARGFLSSYQLYSPVSTLSLAGVHTVAGDYNKRELGAALQESTVTGDAVSTYHQHCDGARALIFAWSIESSEQIAAAFRLLGVPAAHVDGETPAFQRRADMDAFRDGRLRVICSVDIFGEGVDIAAVDAVFLLRPTQSLGLYLQQVGRGLRVAPGKQSVRIFDHVNNWQRHGLPDDPRVWSLDGAASRSRASEPMGKRCGVCFAVSRIGATACVACGLVFPVQAREVTQVAGALAAVDVDVLRQLGLRAPEPPHTCQKCGERFVLKIGNSGKFCSRKCYMTKRDEWHSRTHRI